MNQLQRIKIPISNPPFLTYICLPKLDQMKKIYIYFLLFFTFAANAQTPQGISYQAVARDSTGKLLSNQPIKIKFSIRDSISVVSGVPSRHITNAHPSTNKYILREYLCS